METIPTPAIRGVGSGGPGDKKVMAALRQVVTVRQQRFSIRTLAQALETALQIPLAIDEVSFGEAGVEMESDFPVDVSETPIYEFLSTLEKHSVGYVIEQGRLVLRHSDACREQRSLRFYDVRSVSHIPQDELVQLVLAHCSGPWDVDEPGTGHIQRMGTCLLVRTTLPTQAEVEDFLNLLAANVAQPTP